MIFKKRQLNFKMIMIFNYYRQLNISITHPKNALSIPKKKTLNQMVRLLCGLLA